MTVQLLQPVADDLRSVLGDFEPERVSGAECVGGTTPSRPVRASGWKAGTASGGEPHPGGPAPPDAAPDQAALDLNG